MYAVIIHNCDCNVLCTQELIQNADDAGAKVVRFYIDNRQHRVSSCIDERLAKYHGPALIAANDAKFTEKTGKGSSDYKTVSKLMIHSMLASMESDLTLSTILLVCTLLCPGIG